MTSVPCPRCGDQIGLHVGRPHIGANGVVALYCITCEPLADGEPESLREASPAPLVREPDNKSTRPLRWLVAPVAASLVGAVLLSSWAISAAGASADTSLEGAIFPTIELSLDPSGMAERIDDGSDSPAKSKETVNPDVAAVAASLVARWPMPVWDGVPLDEVYPSLRGWIHPVTGAPEMVPESGGRKFGALREGIMRPECGAGHCGVDLDGPRGRPMVAVAAGRVVRVEHSEMGRDGRSGRYVRIEHTDGTLTAYMHLDVIAEGLSVGDRIDAGQYIGTLGASGILASAPHCHFTLELPLSSDVHGDHTQTRYIDPSPFLARSRIVSMTQQDKSARW